MRMACAISCASNAANAGTSIAMPPAMAAVMALVFLFALASIGLMLKIAVGGLSLTTVLATGCFVALAAGVFVSTLVQAKRWEDET
jgi:hypothetical protein